MYYESKENRMIKSVASRTLTRESQSGPTGILFLTIMREAHPSLGHLAPRET